MKKFLTIIVALLSLGLLFHSCLPPEIEVDSVTLDKTSVTMLVGEIESLTATVLPANATFPEVTWESSDPSVATVKEGFITALKEGTTTITATAWFVSTTCQVTVTSSKDVPVESVSLDKESVELEIGETETLTATVLPENATDKTVEWTSSNPSVAKVAADGTITALAEGTTAITAAAGGKFASCPVTVVKKGEDPVDPEIKVTSVELDIANAEIVTGNTIQITATVLPANATDKTVTWSSSNSSVASVSNGLVTAKKAGSSVITATSGDKRATCTITVTDATVSVTGVELSKTTLSLVEGGKTTLTATVKPDNATDKVVSWSSSDESVATVSADGEVTAVKEGTATITVTTRDGNKTATCAVTVTNNTIPVSSVTLSQKTLTLTEDETATLKATVLPSDASDKNVTWSTSNQYVATVDNNGVVTAHLAGNATITASCGGKQATCSVTVKAKIISVESVEISKTSLKLNVGDKATLSATVLPSNANDKSITWASDDSSIASVNSKGEVTALKEGTTTITVTTNDGGKTASCEVTVEYVEEDVIYVSSVDVTPETLTLEVGQTFSVSATVSPSNATYKYVNWYSLNETVASVDRQTGLVTALQEGEATIRAISHNGKKDECILTVIPPKVVVTGVQISPANLELIEEETATLTATVLPDDAEDKSVTWSSDNEAVATVSQSGVVTAVSAGAATITVTTTDGGKTATCSVTVTAKETPVEPEPENPDNPDNPEPENPENPD